MKQIKNIFYLLYRIAKHCLKSTIKKANPGASIKKYCKRENCTEDCNKCPYPLKEIIRGDL